MVHDVTSKIIAVGDVMLGDSSHFLGRGIGSLIRRRGPHHPWRHVRERIAGADMFIANLESPISASPGKNVWERMYRGAPASLDGLAIARRNITTLANNHIRDHGPSILAETRRILHEKGFGIAGFSEHDEPEAAILRWIDRGVSCIVIAGSLIDDAFEYASGRQATEAWILDKLANEDADVKIVSLHWGDEYVTIPSPEQRRLGRCLIDNGATIVLGHHPHVLQPIEEYRGGLVAYSLGNFLFDQNWTAQTRGAGMLEIVLERGAIASWEFLPTVCDGSRQPRFAAGGTSDRLLDTVHSNDEPDWPTYARKLASASRHHRIAMKMELLRHFWKISPDTLDFLMNRRRRRRVLRRRVMP